MKTGIRRKVGVGIIGFGFMGKIHAYGYMTLPFYTKLPFEPEIRAICTTAQGKTKEEARYLLKSADIYHNFHELVYREDIEIIHISTPNIFHKEAIIEALKLDKHIYCDKPITATLEEAKDVEKYIKEKKGIHRMVFNYRYFPAVMRAKQLIEEGFLGQITCFRSAFFHSGSIDPKRPLGWKERPEFGGGVIADMGSHIFDMIRYLLGEFSQLIAETSVLYPQRPSIGSSNKMEKVKVEDHVTVFVRMKGGSHGIMEASKVATGVSDELRFEIHGTKGAIRFNSLQPNIIEVYNVRDTDAPLGGMRGYKQIQTMQGYPDTNFPGPKFSVGWIDSHIACLRSFLNAIVQKRQDSPDLRDGIRIQGIIAACRESSRKGMWIKV